MNLIVTEIYKLILSADTCFSALVSAGGYHKIDPAVNETTFPLVFEGKNEEDILFLQLDKNGPNVKVKDDQILALMNEMGLAPAHSTYGLVYGSQHLEDNGTYIDFLGNSWNDSEGRLRYLHISRLEGSMDWEPQRQLIVAGGDGPVDWSRGWYPSNGVSFAAVHK